jgi:superfamily II DNA helicase RecQ
MKRTVFRNGDLIFALPIWISDKLRKVHPDTPIIAVTATATEQVKEDIIDNLGLKNQPLLRR